MTKPLPDETLLKCHLTVEDVNKVGEGITRIMDNNALLIRGPVVAAPEREETLIKPKVNAKRSRLGKTMQKLYNLESSSESEKPLRVDLGLDLYQMEEY